MALSQTAIIALLTAFRADPRDKIGIARVTGYDAWGNPISETIDVYQDGSSQTRLAYKSASIQLITLDIARS